MVLHENGQQHQRNIPVYSHKQQSVYSALHKITLKAFYPGIAVQYFHSCAIPLGALLHVDTSPHTNEPADAQ
jgi:hypothetical protein